MTMAYEFSRKQMIFLIRLMVIVVTAYVMLFTPETGTFRTIGYVYIAFYLFTNLVVAYIPERYFHQTRIFSFFVFFDSIMLIIGIYLSGLVGTDLYLVYFLIICLATLSAQFRYLMINVVLFSGLYGLFLYQKGYLTGDLAISYSLRLPFIIVISLFYGFIVTSMLKGKEKRLKETQEEYRQLFQTTDVLVYIVDRNGCYLSANAKLYSQYQMTDEKQILSMPFGEFHTDEETETFLTHVDEVFASGTAVQYESFDSRVGRWYSHSLSPIHDFETRTVFSVSVISKDITERVQKETELTKAYEKLKETRDQLIQKDKMAALGRLASGVAHEIRNPLEIISMGVDYLENIVLRRNPDAKTSIDKIYAAIDRANGIINDVLKFSRKANFQIEPVDISGLMQETLGLAAHHIQKNDIVAEESYPDETLEVAANKNMLCQVLLNLVNNAVDAMQEMPVKRLKIRIYRNKVVEVGYKTGYRRADFFKIGDEMVVVAIQDTGKGMDETVLPKIFEPFFTTKETGKGTGLGLSLAHMIMDRMSGTIDVESKVGEGTTFLVKLQPLGNIEKVREGKDDG